MAGILHFSARPTAIFLLFANQLKITQCDAKMKKKLRAASQYRRKGKKASLQEYTSKDLFPQALSKLRLYFTRGAKTFDCSAILSLFT